MARGRSGKLLVSIYSPLMTHPQDPPKKITNSPISFFTPRTQEPTLPKCHKSKFYKAKCQYQKLHLPTTKMLSKKLWPTLESQAGQFRNC